MEDLQIYHNYLKSNAAELCFKVIREQNAKKFLSNHKITKKQKEQAINILVEFQKFLDKND